MKVGVLLGGGGVRGAAHIGVLRELNRLGVRPDVLTGTSSGGLVAAFYASGCNWDEVEEIARSLTWATAIGRRWPFRRTQPHLFHLIGRYIDGRQLEDLSTRLVLSAFDPSTGEVVLFQEGPLWPALRATLALPGLFSPVQAPSGRILVDGGLVSSLPVHAVRGVERTIAVDVRQNHVERRPPGRISRRRWIYEQAYHALARQVTETSLGHVDLVLRPDVGEINTLDFQQIGSCIEAGADSVKDHADEITALLEEADRSISLKTNH